MRVRWIGDQNLVHPPLNLSQNSMHAPRGVADVNPATPGPAKFCVLPKFNTKFV